MQKSNSGLPAQVAQQLLQRILSKEFAPGAVLPSERELVETYAVSRPVAREALKLLAARGVIAVHPRQGATVGLDLTGAAREALLLAFHNEQVVQEDLLDVRMLIEPHIAALAAAGATSLQLRRLQAIRELSEGIAAALEAGDQARAHELWEQSDAPLHILLAEMSQNPVYKVFIEVIDGILWRQGKESSPIMTEEHTRMANAQHAAICDAVLAGDAEAARQAMVAHLAYTREHVFSARRSLQRPVKVVI
jgi:DNA-binding FadR family transcriptional regulator